MTRWLGGGGGGGRKGSGAVRPVSVAFFAEVYGPGQVSLIRWGRWVVGSSSLICAPVERSSGICCAFLLLFDTKFQYLRALFFFFAFVRARDDLGRWRQAGRAGGFASSLAVMPDIRTNAMHMHMYQEPWLCPARNVLISSFDDQVSPQHPFFACLDLPSLM